MNTPILNREFQHPGDGWYHIEPKGAHLNHTAGIEQVIDDDATQAIVNRFNADAGSGTLLHGREMLVDHEHFKHDDDKETRAYGWLTQLQNRDDGIYGQVRWTGTGRAAVDGGDYRFFSTEYEPGDLEVLDKNGEITRARPLRLAGLTLTNSPNNRGGKPITNREPADAPAAVPATAAAGADNQNRRTTTKLITEKLGLSADATEEAILDALATLQNREAESRRQAALLATERDALANRVAEINGEQIDADLDGHGIKDETVRNKLKPVLAGMKNRAERVDFLGLLPKTETKGKIPVTNRETAKTPGAALIGGSESEAEVATKIKNRANELKGSAPRRTFGECWNQARGEVLGAETKQQG